MTTTNGKPLNIQLLIAFISFMFIGMLPGILNVAWKHMETTFGVELDSLGLLLGAITVGRLIATFANGYVIGNYGIGRVILAAVLISMVGVFGYMTSPTFGILLIAGLIVSFGNGIIDAGMNTFVSAYYGKGQLNFLHAFFGVGLTIGPLLVTFSIITLDGSWRLAYSAVLLVQVILLIAVVVTFRLWRMPEATIEYDEQGAVRKAATVRESLMVPAVLLSMALFFVYGGIEVGAGQLSNSLFTESRGISEETASFWISLYWASFTIGRILTGIIGDRISNNSLMRLSIFGTIGGALFLSIQGASIFSFLGLALLGFALAPMFATLISDTPRRVGMRHVANAIGFQIGFAGFGAAVLPGLAGIFASRIDLEIIGPFLLVNAVGLFFLHEFIMRREANLENRANREKEMMNA
ncbi:MAG: MFS transporter [Aggregatilineales bacterium]